MPAAATTPAGLVPAALVPAALVLAALVLAALVPALGPLRSRTDAAAATPRGHARRPNILFVLTDDLDLAEMRFLPHVQSLVARSGTTFDQYLVSNSVCCPSRTTTLRGQYSHNTGVWSNGGDNGGFERAHADGVETDTVATRLHDAGYTTSLVGKYLNGYPNSAPRDDVPPGWDDWASAVDGNAYSEYDYVLNQNQTYHVYQHRPRDYGTDVYVGLTDHFIRGAVQAHQPFFAYLSVYAPHQPATPAPEDEQKFRHARAPHTPSFDQADVSRSPSYVRDLPRFSAEETTAINAVYRKRIRSLQAVDRGVARLMQTLRATKQLSNTYVVFASDNGFHLGQHRLPAGKRTPYETDIHVPLLVRGPGVRGGRTRRPARRQHRSRADVRGDGRSARTLVHRRPLAPPRAARRAARSLAHLLPPGAPAGDRLDPTGAHADPGRIDARTTRSRRSGARWPAASPRDPRRHAPQPRGRDRRLRRGAHHPVHLRGVRHR